MLPVRSVRRNPCSQVSVLSEVRHRCQSPGIVRSVREKTVRSLPLVATAAVLARTSQGHSEIADGSDLITIRSAGGDGWSRRTRRSHCEPESMANRTCPWFPMLLRGKSKTFYCPVLVVRGYPHPGNTERSDSHSERSPNGPANLNRLLFKRCNPMFLLGRIMQETTGRRWRSA
jgi:hypothetical protein